ncbi:MAG: ABC transporter substrate-binding protein [Candidatus Hermodarchaeota archaeon]
MTSKEVKKFGLIGCFMVLGLILTFSPNLELIIPGGSFNGSKRPEVTLHSQSERESLIFGTSFGPSSIDPHYVWDKTSVDVIEQVVETLFAYNLSDPELRVIPRLAADFGTWSEGGLVFTVPLREKVTFHDGTRFNATAVKWNFDRLAYFMNLDGSLPEEIPVCSFSSLFLWTDGTPVINTVNIISEYTVEFVLNRPYVPFKALICCSGAGMLSPDPLSTPQHEYIDFLTGTLVGTGPFVYEGYIENIEVNFHANPDYWAGLGEIDDLKFVMIPNPYERSQALLNGEIDITTTPDISLLQDLNAHPDISLVDAGQSTTTWYLLMNNAQIPVATRKAISYALDYSDIIERLTSGEAIRLRSPLPEGILYANWSLDAPETDIITARTALIESDYYTGLPAPEDHQAWLDLVSNGNPIETYKYIYAWGSPARVEMLNILEENLQALGILVIGEGMTIGELYDRIKNYKDEQHLFMLGWGTDYNDPSDYIDPLFGASSPNYIQMDDAQIEQWISAGLSEADPIARERIYDNIQQRLIEVLYPMCWLFVDKNYDAHSNKFAGFPSNPLDKVWFYVVGYTNPVQLKLSGSFDFLLKEDIHLQIAALLTDKNTGDPISHAIVKFTVYDPNRIPIIQGLLVETKPNTGVYLNISQLTMKEMTLPKGIYLVYAHARSWGGSEAVDMIQFHIDPPSIISLDLSILLQIGLIGVIVVSIIGMWLFYRIKGEHKKDLI